MRGEIVQCQRAAAFQTIECDLVAAGRGPGLIAKWRDLFVTAPDEAVTTRLDDGLESVVAAVERNAVRLEPIEMRGGSLRESGNFLFVRSRGDRGEVGGQCLSIVVKSTRGLDRRAASQIEVTRSDCCRTVAPAAAFQYQCGGTRFPRRDRGAEPAMPYPITMTSADFDQ